MRLAIAYMPARKSQSARNSNFSVMKVNELFAAIGCVS